MEVSIVTYYDLDGTPYGPTEYAADVYVINQAKANGSRAPYEVERRVADYNRGDNPFDRKYERRKTIDDEEDDEYKHRFKPDSDYFKDKSISSGLLFMIVTVIILIIIVCLQIILS